MPGYDLLDEYTTAIAPTLGPQALMTKRPGMRPTRPHHRANGWSGRPAPIVLIALVCILLAFV